MDANCAFFSQGKIFVRGDSKVFRFFNGKSESLFLQRKNPRRIAWTVLYRRQHRKGISEVRTTPPRNPKPFSTLPPMIGDEMALLVYIYTCLYIKTGGRT
jgi:large subunit ribosomal protein L24e